ncbi:MAG: SH3 domain-containing protein [Gemmatimonadota bacterium]|nr:SH3 domain-containing protein [Gemmatimonadota bacterium]
MSFPDRATLHRCAVRILVLGLVAGLAPSPARSQSAPAVRLTVPEENFRKEPRVSAGNRLATVLEGTVMALEGRDGRWRQVALEGWIWRPSVSPDDREGFDLVVSKAGGENLRERPDAGSRRLAVLERGMLLDELERQGNWVRVRRVAWIWSGSVTETSRVPGPPPDGAGRAPPAAGSDPAPDAPAALPDHLVVGDAPLRLHVSPEGDTLGVLRSGTDVAVVERRGEWARVSLEGWVWVPGTLPSDSATAGLTPADVRANPDRFRGRLVRWTLQVIALERAEAVRTDFFEGEPFLLTRPADQSEGFVYVAVPPELLEEAQALRSLSKIDVLGRVRTGRSAVLGVPILDLVALR